ncbi:hypothetical protein CEP51_012406 [Fusarium floridanum]|uniref:Uncharacterized protein n=1 Tax=Fusarium floridanum TaxID=1325733 RepID=A0A428QUU3_9HYPO|nr:hypothetical protein CEP51_012406 [Fusarium floridanum]
MVLYGTLQDQEQQPMRPVKSDVNSMTKNGTLDKPPCSSQSKKGICTTEEERRKHQTKRNEFPSHFPNRPTLNIGFHLEAQSGVQGRDWPCFEIEAHHEEQNKGRGETDKVKTGEGKRGRWTSSQSQLDCPVAGVAMG